MFCFVLFFKTDYLGSSSCSSSCFYHLPGSHDAFKKTSDNYLKRGRANNLEKAMAPYLSTLAWKIPWTGEPGGLQSMGSHRVRHDSATSLSLFTFIGEGNGNPLQCSCLENPRDGEAWWAAIYGVIQSRTWLKQLSSSSSIRANVLVWGLFWSCYVCWTKWLRLLQILLPSG